MIAQYINSIDLGETSDYTAHAVIEHEMTRQGVLEYHVTHIERYNRRPYPEIVRHVTRLLKAPPLMDDSVLVLDQTGVGRPVVQMFFEALHSEVCRGLLIIPITITGGGKVGRDGGSIHVPKKILANTVAALLHQDRLVISEALKEAKTARKELENFRVRFNVETGNQTFAAREREHDDVVLSLALGLWFAETFKDVEGRVLRAVYS